jgi:hypothetical protein
MTTAQEEAEKLRKEAAGKLAEAERLARLQAAYPNLKKHVGRWDKIAYCTSAVNGLVTDYDLRHNCGCCRDSPLEVWPYLQTPDGKVYSDPPMFRVGEKDPLYGGDVAEPGWRGKLQAAGIPTALLDRIKHHFRDERERALEAADAIYKAEDDE